MLALDTYSYVRKLKDAGMSEKLASVQVEAFYGLVQSRLATKQDLEKISARIDNLESRMDARIDSLESKMDARIDNLESKMDARIDNLESKMDARITKMALTVTALLGVLMTIYKFVHF